VDIETLWAITAAVVPAALSLGIGLMTLTGYQIGARVCFLLAGVWLGVIGFMWLVHTPTALPYRIAAGLGIGAFVFVAVPLFLRLAWPPENAMAQSNNPSNSGSPPIVTQGPGSAFSYGQQGGQTIGTYVAPKPQSRQLRAAQAEKIRAALMGKRLSLVVVGSGSEEAIRFANEIEGALRSANQDVVSASVQTSSPAQYGLRILPFSPENDRESLYAALRAADLPVEQGDGFVPASLQGMHPGKTFLLVALHPELRMP
jgi:hypothetical protein